MLIKRGFDFIVALLGLLVLSPVFVITAILIKIDSPGPVFFRQERVGKRGTIFRILKFRTMHIGAERQGQITVGRDSRVTGVGLALRRYKIDELPQLINILKGEMSLVGPRPEVPRFVGCYPDAVREEVLSVLPGVTDWASIEFSDESTVLGLARDPERSYIDEILPVKLDYYVRYVRQRSFLMDLHIIVGTLYAIASKVRSHS